MLMLTDAFILKRANKKLAQLAQHAQRAQSAQSKLSPQQQFLAISIAMPDGTLHQLGPNPQVHLAIHHIKALGALTAPSLDSLAQAYIEGWLDIEGDISQVIRQAVNLSQTELAPSANIARMVPKSIHTKKADQASIQYHYDVSNDFYAQWLDPAMVYSCAYFENGNETLEEAQQKKIDHILKKIQLRPGETLLDIGCGWGALALRAAQGFGARVVGITLSKQQHALATERVMAAGLSGQIDIRLQDYRDITETFDKITSVGMFEHVGLKNLAQYFQVVHDRLKPGGLAMNHGVTSTDIENRETPFGGGAFIDQYVFPNGELPHIGTVLKEIEAAGLETLDVENLRRHYTMTSQEWSRRFELALPKLCELVPQRTLRIWRVYLPGVAWAFQDNWISLNQILSCHAGRQVSLNPTPMNRRYMYE
jgi:cyclopropane-fatty-acyl-phospholipid synthase